MRKALNLYIAFSKMAIFTMLILSIQCLPVSICNCIGQVRIGVLVEQPYQVPVSKHFLAPAIVFVLRAHVQGGGAQFLLSL